MLNAVRKCSRFPFHLQCRVSGLLLPKRSPAARVGCPCPSPPPSGSDHEYAYALPSLPFVSHARVFTLASAVAVHRIDHRRIRTRTAVVSPFSGCTPSPRYLCLSLAPLFRAACVSSACDHCHYRCRHHDAHQSDGRGAVTGTPTPSTCGAVTGTPTSSTRTPTPSARTSRSAMPNVNGCGSRPPRDRPPWNSGFSYGARHFATAAATTGTVQYSTAPSLPPPPCLIDQTLVR